MWSVDVEGAGLNDQYRYVINTNHWRTDPRAGDVVNSVDNGIIVDSNYDWTPFTPPAWNDMVIYEMHIGTYYDTPGGSPGTWLLATSKLDHIQSLGVNAIELMPIAEIPGDYSLGYNPVHIFSPESAYGSPDDLRNFIDQCHQRGIAVLIDVVYNHFGPSDLSYSLWQFDGYYSAPDTGGIYFYEDDNRYTPWGDRPNFLTDEVRSFIRDNVMYWLNDYNMDGLRMDGTAYIRERDIGGPDIPEGWSLMQWINDEIDAAHSQKICIAEDMRDNDWITRTTGEGGAGFDSQWDAEFHHKVVPALTAVNDADRNMSDVSYAISHLYNGWDTQRVIYTESHDEVGSSSGNSRVPDQISPSDPSSYYAKKRSTLGAGLVFTCPGIPMMFMGQEFLEDGSWDDYDSLDWSKSTTYQGIEFLYTDLIGMRRNLLNVTTGLTGKNVNVFHVDNTNKVIAFHRWLNGGAGDDVVVVANFSSQSFGSYNIGMPQSGQWKLRLNSDWDMYDAGFGNYNTTDVTAVAGAKDGLSYNANIAIGPYSIVIFSQGAGLDILRILTGPDYQVVNAGNVANFEITVFSQSAETYQWYKYVDGGSDITLSDGGDISGATTVDLSIANAEVADEGHYYCIVNNAAGTQAVSDKALLGVKRRIAYWPFEGNNANSTIAGSPVSFLYGDPNFVTTGILGDAMEFDNDANAQDILHTDPDEASYFDICNYSMTVACWIKSTFAATWGPIVARNGEDLQGWQLRHNGGTVDRICFTTRGTGNDDGTASNRTVYDGDWHFAVGTYDGAVKKVYIDGILSRTYNSDDGSLVKEYDPASGLINSTPSPVALAGRVKGDAINGLTFEDVTPGILDEVEIYNYALDAVAIAQIYADMTGTTVCPDSVALAYDLDGDCVVNINDIAKLASEWLDDSKVYAAP